jgi:hypothetical protein
MASLLPGGVSLALRSGGRFVVAGLRVLRANQAEAPALWELLETFLEAVGRSTNGLAAIP